MKHEVFNLIQKYNTSNYGILITQDLNDYVFKLLNNATIITYTENSLMAFVAFYCNDEKNEDAYLSLILVDDILKGKGIGKSLLKTSINILEEKGFKNFRLEVLKNNKPALKLYKSFDFTIVAESDHFYKMLKEL